MTDNSKKKPWYQDISERYKFQLKNLRVLETVDQLVDGYCVICNKDRYALAYKDKTLIAEGDSFYLYRFIMLRLFLDKYRTGNYPLPEVRKHSRWAAVEDAEQTVRENRIAMEIMLKPLETYEDLLARFEEVKATKELGWDIKEDETFNGHESQDDGTVNLYGSRPDYQSPSYRVIKPVEDNVWDVFYEEERSYKRILTLRIYGAQYLYEYLLNLHLSAVL